jgi:hypothetical protein
MGIQKGGVVGLTTYQNMPCDGHTLDQANIMPGHLGDAALPRFCGEEVRVVDGPDVAMQLPQAEVAKCRAAAIVNQHERSGSRRLVPWRELDSDWILVHLLFLFFSCGKGEVCSRLYACKVSLFLPFFCYAFSHVVYLECSQ